MNTHVFLTAAIDSGLLSDAEVIAFSRLLDFLAAYHMEHYTFTLEDLGNLWGRTRPLKTRQVREYVSALKRLPWLDVVSASGQVVISLRPDRLPHNDGASSAESGSIIAESGANDAVSVQSGGDYRGGAWLVASGSDPIRVNLLFQGVTRELGSGTKASNQASNKYGAALHRYRIDSAQLVHRERIGSALLPPHQGCTDSAQIAHRERASSASQLDVPDDLLHAVLNALDALPPANGVSESSARAIIADALERGVAPEAILAVALAVGARAKTEAVGGGLFRSLVGKPDPAGEVPRAFLDEARKILGLQSQDGEENALSEPLEVEIVGKPPYDPAAVWEGAKEILAGHMDARDFRTWIAKTAVVEWREAPRKEANGAEGVQATFTIGVPNAFTKEWLRNRLHKQIKEALEHIAAHRIDVMYVVDRRLREPTKYA